MYVLAEASSIPSQLGRTHVRMSSLTSMLRASVMDSIVLTYYSGRNLHSLCVQDLPKPCSCIICIAVCIARVLSAF